jgi:hypothetical protein
MMTLIPLAEWLPLAVVGSTFTFLGSMKLYGVAKGIAGGHDKSIVQKLCGT